MDKFPLKNNRNSPEIVIFQDPILRRNQAQVTPGKPEVNRTPDVARQEKVISLKRAKYDVRKFGISGFDKRKKKEAKMQLAIELGARPYKRKGKNYKDLVVELKAKKAADEERRQKERQMGIMLPKAKPKKGAERIRGLNCQVGRYKNGFQMIPKRLLSKKQRLQLEQPSE